VNGDSVISKSTLSLGGSVQEACEAITKDWSAHGAAIRASSAASAADPKAAAPPESSMTKSAGGGPVTAPVAASSLTGKVTVSSLPDGADIYVDDNFVGNAPATFKLSPGKHTVKVSQDGYNGWTKELSVIADSEVNLKAALGKN